MSNQRKTEVKEFPFVLEKMDDKAGTFTGYASVWGVVDSFGDVVMPGAFKRTLKRKKSFPILWSHNILEPVGTLTGQEDDTGLRVEGRLTLDVQRARELRALMLDGAVNGLSIGYQTIKEEFDKDSGLRRLKEINLWEVSLCVFQACPGAEVSEVKDGDPVEPDELKPFPNEHACRLRDPKGFQEDSFRRIKRRHDGKAYSIIVGKLEGEDTMTEQSYRYAKDTWDADEARAHCKDHDGKFEAAADKCEPCGPLSDADLSDADPGKPPPASGDSISPAGNLKQRLPVLDKYRLVI